MQAAAAIEDEYRRMRERSECITLAPRWKGGCEGRAGAGSDHEPSEKERISEADKAAE